MFCADCGTETSYRAKFCPACGHDLRRQRARRERRQQSTRFDETVTSVNGAARSVFWRRFRAFLIDSVIIWVGTEALVSTGWFFASFLSDLEQFFPLAAALAYYVAGTTIWGRTLGKAAVGIRVVGPDGNPPNLVRTIIRETVGKFLSWILLIGFLMAAGREKLALHDRISGTQVEDSALNWQKVKIYFKRTHDDL